MELTDQSDCDFMQENSGYYDEDENWHSVTTYTCMNCSLKYVKEQATIIEYENCMMYRVEKYSFYAEDELFDEYEVVTASEYHAWTIEVELKEDSQTCEDGVIRTKTCQYCNKVVVDEIKYHEEEVVDEINFDDYKEACGGFIQRQVCACETSQYLNLALFEICYFAYEDTSYTDDKGIVHSVTTSTCRNCPVSIVSDTYEVPDETNPDSKYVTTSYVAYYDGEEYDKLVYTEK